MAEQKSIAKIREKAKDEVKKIVVLTNMREIVKKLIVVMKRHIGEENRISRINLFKSVYGIKPEDVSQLQEWLLWEMIRRGMHRMRQRTTCFIVSKVFPISRYSSKYQGIWNYWVANDMTDFIVYRDNIHRNIRAMNNMVKKCERSIVNKWYEEDWTYK